MSRAKTNNENSKSMRKGNEKIAYQGKRKKWKPEREPGE
jgi:hypothetical protein